VKPEPIDLDRTEVRRVADATRLLIQRVEAALPADQRRRARMHIEAHHRLSSSTLSILVRMPLPWRIQPEMLARLEAALGVEAGDVLAGRCPRPATEKSRRTRIYRVERHVGASAR
jgi:hypothetical protein